MLKLYILNILQYEYTKINLKIKKNWEFSRPSPPRPTPPLHSILTKNKMATHRANSWSISIHYINTLIWVEKH